MSRANITSMNPEDHSVTFQLRNGESRTYWYDPSDFIAILGGADPASFAGSQDPPAASSTFGTLADAVIDIGEIGAL